MRRMIPHTHRGLALLALGLVVALVGGMIAVLVLRDDGGRQRREPRW